MHPVADSGDGAELRHNVLIKFCVAASKRGSDPLIWHQNHGGPRQRPPHPSTPTKKHFLNTVINLEDALLYQITSVIVAPNINKSTQLKMKIYKKALLRKLCNRGRQSNEKKLAFFFFFWLSTCSVPQLHWTCFGSIWALWPEFYS